MTRETIQSVSRPSAKLACKYFWSRMLQFYLNSLVLIRGRLCSFNVHCNNACLALGCRFCEVGKSGGMQVEVVPPDGDILI